MTEDQILQWMRQKMTAEDITDASELATSFLEQYNIKSASDPNFSKTIQAGFKIAPEIAQNKKTSPTDTSGS
jgi:hypothetical protein